MPKIQITPASFVPQAGRTPTAGNLDGGMAEAGQRLGATLTGAAVEQLALDNQKRQAADRVQTMTSHASIQNGLADYYDALAADVTSGKVKREDAQKAWNETSTKIIDDNLKTVNPEVQPLLRAQVQGLTGQLNNRLQDAFRARDQQDIAGGLVTYREQQQRFANTDIGAAIKQWDVYVDQMGPEAGWNPERIAKEKQGFREQVKYTQGYSMVSQAGNSIGNLRAVQKRLGSDEFSDLDPQRRAVLDSTLTSKIASLENQAIVRQQAAFNRAQSTYTAFSEFMDSGRMPTADYSQKVLAQVKGTPFEAAVAETLKQAPQTVAFSSTPVKQQALELQAMASNMNKNGSNPLTESAYKKREGVLRATLADIEKDPLNAALERNVIPEISPLNVTDIASLPRQLSDRLTQVSGVSAWAGHQVSPFTRQEADTLGQVLTTLPPDRKATALQTLAKVIPPQQMLAVSKQLGEKDGNLGIAAVLSGRDSTLGRNVGEIYLKGNQALADGRVKIDTAKETGTKAIIAERLQGVYATQQATDAAQKAVFSVYAQLRTEGRDSINDAISMVTGGIKKHNGSKIAKPYGWTDNRFDDYLKTVTPATMGADKLLVNGVETGAAEVASKLPGARLLPAGDSAYMIQSGSDVVRLPTGAPYVLRVR